jgi:hypothetical protein
MFILSDRVKETSTTTGSGSIVFNGAYGAFQSFNDGIGDGNKTYYAIENYTRWEVGEGVYNASTNSLSRDVIFDSSASGERINLQGVSIVFCTLPASKAVAKDAENTITISGIYFYDQTFQNTAGSSPKKVFDNVISDFTASVLSEIIFLDTTNNNINIFLPPASGNGGKELTVKLKNGSNSGVLWPSGNETIDGQTQIGIFHTYQSLNLISDNFNWFIS